jgi:hypothetical protein
MKTTTLQLLPTTTYGTPSGTYDGSSADFNGVRQQAANYYGGYGTLQTIAFYLSGFQGKIQIQATLESDPTDSQWFRVYEIDYTDSSEITENFSQNITGNFVWLRARVENFTAGTISKLMLSY